jgi:hypothetical protein
MKKILLSLLVVVSSLTAMSQVIFKVQSPSVISGLYSFTSNGDGSNWGLPNLNNPADAVEDTLKIVNDGTPGLNAQGNPKSAEGCSAIQNNLTGKIAVIYRGTCTFAVKAKNAQNAGARAVVFINNVPGTLPLGGGTVINTVTIPVSIISNSDGALIVNQMATDSVIVFLGNKINFFANDLATKNTDVMVAKQFASPTLLSQNATEFNIDLGLKVRNYGTSSATGATVTASVKYNGSDIYTNTSSPFNLPVADSIFVDFPQFSQSSYSPGKYTLSYTINNSLADQDTSDNTYRTDFVISDTLFSYAPLNSVTNLPIANSGTQPATFSSEYDACIAFQNPNANRIQAEGLYFSASTNAADSLAGQEIVVSVYEITDVFDDFVTAPAAGSVNFFPLTQGFYSYPANGNQANLQRTMIYKPFAEIVELENDKRYMFCAQAKSSKVFIGYNTKLNYETNIDSLLQPLVPVISDGSVNLAGFGGDNVPALALKVNANTVGIAENNKIDMNAFPNPTKGNLTITIPENGNGSVRITDITGKEVMNVNVTFANNKSVVNTENLEAGMYIVNVIVNSKVAQTTIVKQ